MNTTTATTSSSPSSKKKTSCEQMYKKYHSKFSSIETLTSDDFLRDFHTGNNNNNTTTSNGNNNTTVTLVDVRTKAEQKVSMIPGAITLHEFELNLKQNPKKWRESGQLVVTYCTIGYRSGLEAQRLRELYHIGNIKHLDGIVPYTHACSTMLSTMEMKEHKDSVSGKMMSLDLPFLIDPKTKKATQKVHVFGSTWDVASDDFQTVSFSKLDMAIKGVRVGFKAAILQVKEKFQKCCCSRSCCCHYQTPQVA